MYPVPAVCCHHFEEYTVSADFYFYHERGDLRFCCFEDTGKNNRNWFWIRRVYRVSKKHSGKRQDHFLLSNKFRINKKDLLLSMHVKHPKHLKHLLNNEIINKNDDTSFRAIGQKHGYNYLIMFFLAETAWRWHILLRILVCFAMASNCNHCIR